VGALPFTIRPARPDDVATLCLLKWHLALAEGATHAVRAGEADWQRDMFGPTPRFSAIVAEIDGTVGGMATLVPRYSPGWVGPLLVLNDLFVLPDHRGRGIAKALMRRAAAAAMAQGAPFLELTVRDDNPARRFYRKLGFARVRGAEIYVLAGDALIELAGTQKSAKSA
jgi:ribosomal protein S18 acetylase RimI-like enzyme